MRQQIVLNPINYNHRPRSLPTALEQRAQGTNRRLTLKLHWRMISS